MWDGYIQKFLQRFFGFWLSPDLKEIMVPGRSFNLPASKCLYRSWSDPGEGPGGPPPLRLDQTVARKAEQNFFRPPHSPYLRVWMTGPSLI